jgi:uncharacterized membrane protein
MRATRKQRLPLAVPGLLALAALLVGATRLPAQGAQLILLTDAAAGLGVAAQDVTPDGSVVVGTSNGQVFRWTEAGGSVMLSGSDPMDTTQAAVSDDGSIIASAMINPVSGWVEPAYWTQAGGWTFLGCLPGVPPTPDPTPQCGFSYDISGDGSKIVGLAWHGDTYKAESFLWDAADGMVGLGMPAGASSRGSAISADGHVVGGFYEHESWGYRRPVRWIDGGAPDLFVDANTLGEVGGLSTDGGLVTGGALLVDENGFPVPPWTTQKAFLFSAATGFRYVLPIFDYDVFNTEQSAFANGVADDGTVVGWSGDMGPWGQVFPAIACPGDTRMLDFNQVLADQGATIPADILLTSALRITPDGHTVVGQAFDMTNFVYVPFVARFPNGPCGLLSDGFESGDTSAWSQSQP